MTIDPSTVLGRLDRESDTQLPNKLRKWLADSETRSILDKPVRITVNEAKRLWSTRVEVSKMTGHEIAGAEFFLKRLDLLAPQVKLEQFSFAGSRIAGNIFFESSSRRFVGAVMVDQTEIHKRSAKPLHATVAGKRRLAKVASEDVFTSPAMQGQSQ